MTDFVNGTASILEGGTMFEEGAADYVCVISEELVLLYENGTEQNLGVIVGKDGADGEKGESGRDGVSEMDVSLTITGEGSSIPAACSCSGVVDLSSGRGEKMKFICLHLVNLLTFASFCAKL